jgi:hypothetical protein
MNTFDFKFARNNPNDAIFVIVKIVFRDKWLLHIFNFYIELLASVQRYKLLHI